MDKISFAEIMKFRNETQELRHKFIVDIDDALRVIDSDPETAGYDKEVIEIIQKLETDFKKLENDLSDVRSKVFAVIYKGSYV
ncbi:MAG: hypothetical protein HC802_13005 [Caldilineaceae bacterium]|nr:hypothetical protein [Caldilineaceae bacterium]